MSRRVALLGAAAAAFVAVSVADARPAAPPALQGTVGPGFTISLMQNGKRVTHLKAGSYRFVVADRAAIHNFVLEKSKGGTFEKEITAVGFTGTKTVMIRLTPGKWQFYCRPHESMMHGEFTVS